MMIFLKKSYFLPYSKHYHPLPSVPQIKAIIAKTSRRSKGLWGSRGCRSPGLEKNGLTLHELQTEKRANVWKKFMYPELRKNSSFKSGQWHLQALLSGNPRLHIYP
jgi:hypothetical protein